MINSVKETILKYNMLKNRNSVTVALSGGADSVALTHILYKLKDELGFDLYAAHLNHGIRGKDADRDAEFVKTYCKELNIPLFCEKVDIPRVAEKYGDSIETVARNVRYEFLTRVSVGVIATAHTASDNLETVIFNEIRGAGLKGVCGIPPIRDNIIRPLINCTREDVEEYCKQNNLEFCTDKTNFCDEYSRNNIRLNVVPVLKKINRNAERNILRMCETVRSDEEFLESVSKEEYKNTATDRGLDTEKLNLLHTAIKNRVIKKFLTEKTATAPENRHIFEISELSGGKLKSVNLKNDFIARIDKNQLIIMKAEKFSHAEVSEDYFVFPKDFRETEYKNYRFELINFEEIVNFRSSRFQNAIDYDTILDNPIIRNRKSGDKFTDSRRKITKTLKKLFTEQKTENRDRVLLLCDSENVIWVENIGVNAKNRVNEKTRRVLFIKKTGDFNGKQ